MHPDLITPYEIAPALCVDLRALVERCNAAEGLDLPIQLEPGPAGDLVLCCVAGQLVGLAQVRRFADAEVCLCVDLPWRRRGFGRALLEAAAALGQPSERTVLVADLAGAAGPAFAAAVGARPLFAEQRLSLDFARVPPAPPPLAGLTVRQAGPGDLAALVLPIAAAFGDPRALVERFVAQRLAQPGQRFLLAEIAGQPVGALRLSPDGGWVYINAFAVLPSRQGQGIGRRMLLRTIDLLRAEGEERIRIEVESDNPRARHLYAACGFVADATFQYYQLA